MSIEAGGRKSAAGGLRRQIKKLTGRQTATPTQGLEALTARLRRDRVTRIALSFLDRYEGVHLKDVTVDQVGAHRHAVIEGRRVVNFGSDSFLGLDCDRRLREAIAAAAEQWGTHNGSSRAFSSVELCCEAERRLARWLGVPDTLIFPTVTLANVGLIPALLGRGDLLVVDRQSHDSVQQGAKLAGAEGAKVVELASCTGDALRRILEREKYDGCVLAVDGVYSMTGKTPPLAELDAVVRQYGGTMYVDDAHGTGVLGQRGRGAAHAALGTLQNVLMIGSLSKAFSCLGAFVTCTPQLKRLMKIRSSTFIFGGPVPPPYLAGILAVCDIIESPEYDTLLETVHCRIQQLTDGVERIGLRVLGSHTPIVSVLVGDIEKTLEAGKRLFDRGYYVQSATYPAVPVNGGLLRIQLSANHQPEAIDGLLEALEDLKADFKLRG